MNAEQCCTMMEALEQGCQSSGVFWAAMAEVWALRPGPKAELQQSGGASGASSDAEDPVAYGAEGALVARRSTLTPTGPGEVGWTEGVKKPKKASATASAASSDTEGPKKPKKAKKADTAEGVPKEKRPASAAVIAWNLLVTKTVSDMRQSGWESWTDAKGVLWPASKVATVKGAEQYVYDGGDHDGKPPSPALGGMLRASYLKGKGASQVEGLQGEWAELEKE